jgi:hypothetical protein
MNRRHAIWITPAALLVAIIGWKLLHTPHTPLALDFVGYEGTKAIFRVTNASRYVYCGHSTTKPIVTGNTMDGWPWTVSARGVERIWIPVRRTDVEWELQMSFARQSILEANWARQPVRTGRSLLDFARGRARVHYSPWPTNEAVTLRSGLVQPPASVAAFGTTVVRNVQPDGPANVSQPIRSVTNSTSSAAGSRP